MDELKIVKLRRMVRNANRLIGEDSDVYCVCCNKVFNRYYFVNHKETRKHLRNDIILRNQIDNAMDPRLDDVLDFINRKN